MATDDMVSVPVRLPLAWWRRLQRIARHCSSSSDEFVREMLEAEIVRREVLGGMGEIPVRDWTTERTTSSSTQLH
jgi:hypothetical protein